MAWYDTTKPALTENIEYEAFIQAPFLPTKSIITTQPKETYHKS